MKTLCDYTTRLERCGIAAHNAVRICCDFLKEFSGEDLEEFIYSGAVEDIKRMMEEEQDPNKRHRYQGILQELEA